MNPVNETIQPPIDKSQEIDHEALHRAHMGPRWAAILGLLAIGALYLLLPDKLIIGPSWLLLLIEAILLLPLVVSWLIRYRLPHRAIRVLALALLAVTTLALAIGIALLVYTLKGERGDILLRSAGTLWVLNILVFALWYFEIDGGGPMKRHLSGHRAADFMFPQQAPGNTDTNWTPHFVDYLFLAFTGATALSPADTYPLTRKAKALMIVEAMFSLVVIVLLAARAVNILGQ